MLHFSSYLQAQFRVSQSPTNPLLRPSPVSPHLQKLAPTFDAPGYILFEFSASHVALDARLRHEEVPLHAG